MIYGSCLYPGFSVARCEQSPIFRQLSLPWLTLAAMGRGEGGVRVMEVSGEEDWAEVGEVEE